VDDRYTQDPDARLDYTWDWSSWLQADDTILTATVTAELKKEEDELYWHYQPQAAEFIDDVPMLVEDVTFTTTHVTAWLSGGTLDRRYDAVCSIETSDGRKNDKTTIIKVKER